MISQDKSQMKLNETKTIYKNYNAANAVPTGKRIPMITFKKDLKSRV